MEKNSSIDMVINYWNPRLGEHYLNKPKTKNSKMEEIVNSAVFDVGGRRLTSDEEYMFMAMEYAKRNDKYINMAYPTKKNETYFFIPTNLTITRASSYMLGEGVLGRTWPGTGIIEVIDWLQGNDFHEVAWHEILHNKYPNDTEYMIRQKTRQSLPFEAKWN